MALPGRRARPPRARRGDRAFLPGVGPGGHRERPGCGAGNLSRRPARHGLRPEGQRRIFPCRGDDHRDRPREVPLPSPAGGPPHPGDAVKTPPPRILFVDGPNLNVLGEREPSVYGKDTLAAIRKEVSAAARAAGATVEFFQSNHEGEIVERLQQARGAADGLVINPAGYTHTSVAIRDALLFCGVPAIEVHLSNPARREPFRKVSLVEDVVLGRICGVGGHGYVLALQALLRHLGR
ncbi:MAG: type II 3-dehydroquinate dehydratase [Deltaproteobacteria bacterium]|nr:MAG: type II 3-dehydroquinate dehydratase [Deltaproteobacteria bacterium]